ncbi:hypothetical protein POM88_050999 [Heracleum sosnowskyi]|uniref:Uncharacterized protein n=1 Tax=Heracleum sosnowskyi TaxID=360622 RepID=A0AAD8GZT3_9APIA|nr:hypothetical protein POM88_050999 [Heracleum sosnowskyi]
MNSMYMITSKCKVVGKLIRETPVLLNLNHHIRPLCTGKVEDEHTGNTTKEEGWCYDPTIKYQALRRCAVPRYAFYHDSATDWSDTSASDCEIQTQTMAQTHKDKGPAITKEENIFRYDPNLNYQVVKQFAYLDSPDRPHSFTYDSSDSEREIKEVETMYEAFRAASREDKIFLDPDFKYARDIFGTETETQVETEIMAEEEDKIPKDEQLFRYDPSIKYEPLKRYVVPRFAFCDTSSTDWSDSADSSAFSESEPETETKIMAAEEPQA